MKTEETTDDSALLVRIFAGNDWFDLSDESDSVMAFAGNDTVLVGPA